MGDNADGPVLAELLSTVRRRLIPILQYSHVRALRNSHIKKLRRAIWAHTGFILMRLLVIT